MPRANRYGLAGQICHLTHRCHNRAFLLQFGRDRDVYRQRNLAQLPSHQSLDQVRPRRTRSVVAGLILVALLSVSAPGQQPRAIVPREVATDPATNFIERVGSTQALWCAVSDLAKVLIVGHQPGHSAQITLYPLDASGQVITSAPPWAVGLPKPAALAGYSNVAVAAAVHPTLPMLYVLQDLAGPTLPPIDGPVKSNVVFNELDRLFVFEVTNGTARLVRSFRGPLFRYGAPFGPGVAVRLAVGKGARRLYLPFLSDTNNWANSFVGAVDLDAQGMPALTNGQLSVADRLSIGYWIAGYGWIPVATNTVVVNGYFGLKIWNHEDRRARLQDFNCEGTHSTGIEGNPNGLVLYRSYANAAVYAVQLVDGRPSLQPRSLAVGGISRPVLAVRPRRLAFGQPGGIVLIHLDADGEMTGDWTRVPVADFAGMALAYSPKFDRLYAAVEKGP